MRLIKHSLFAISAFLFMGNTILFNVPSLKQPQTEVMSSHKMSLNTRYANAMVNDVMRDNILLSVAYLRGIVTDPTQVDWEAIRHPFTYSFELQPGEIYAFQRDSLPEFAQSIKKTTDVHFGASDGFKSDGYLYGDGVCHIASLFYWAAKDAGLTALAPTNHNFAVIPEVPAEYGVAIYSMPGETVTNANQNLYVKNDWVNPIKFEISYDGVNIEAKVIKVKTQEASTVTQEVI